LLGKVSFKANIDGSGIKPETVSAKLIGDVSSLVVKGYEYRDIRVNGQVKGKYFSGELSVQDKYLDADFRGLVDLTEKLPGITSRQIYAMHTCVN
jgi:hypothetical protein